MTSLEQRYRRFHMNFIKSKVVIGEHGGWLSEDGLPLMGITRWIEAVLCQGDPSNGIYVNVPNHILEAAAERGKRIHTEIEMMCNGFDADSQECKIAKMLLPEQQYLTEYVVTDNEMFASAIDLVGEDMTLWDIKTNSKLDDDLLLKYRYQLSIYKFLFEWQTGEQVRGLKILWINKQLKNKVVDIDPISAVEIQDFLYNPQHFKWYKQFINLSKDEE